MPAIRPRTGRGTAILPGTGRGDRPKGGGGGPEPRTSPARGAPETRADRAPSALLAAASQSRGGFTRIVIAVDPPTGGGTCGIVACARDEAGHAHVLADHSVTGLGPEGWAGAVAQAAALWGTAAGGSPRSCPVKVVAEQNQGGKMVAAILHTADPGLRVKLVTATVGKAERAAPIAHLFEAGKVILHGRFPMLEAELLGMIAGGDYQGPGRSPDRADAMVWGLTDLMLGKRERKPRIRRL